MTASYLFYVKRVVAAGFALISLLAIAVVLLYRHAERQDFYFEDINGLVGSTAGYTLRKPGPLALSLWPRPALTTEALSIYNPTVSPTTPIATVGKVSATLQWLPLLTLDLVLDVRTDAVRTDLEIDVDGRQNWMNDELLTITGGLPFDLDKVDARDTAVSFKNLQTGGILAVQLEQFDLDLAEGQSSARIETAGRSGDSRFYALGDAVYARDDQRLDLDLELGAGPAGPPATGGVRTRSVSDWIEVNAGSFGARGSLKGGVTLQDRTPTGRLKFTARVSSLREFDYLAEPLGLASPSLGALDAVGTVHITGGRLGVEDLEVAIRDEAMELLLQGRVTDLLEDPGAEFTLRGHADALSAVIDPGRLPFGDAARELINGTHAITADASVTVRHGSVIIDRLQAGGAVEGLVAEARGRLELGPDGTRIDLDLRAQTPETGALLERLGVEAPPRSLGPAGAALHISGEGRHYAVRGGEVTLQDGNVRADFTGKWTDDGGPAFDLAARLEIKDTGALSPWLPAVPENALAGVNLVAETKLQGSPERFNLQGLDVKLSRGGQRVAARGSIRDLPSHPAANLDVQVDWDEPIPLDDYFPELGPFDLAGPMDITGSIRSSSGRIRIGALTVRATDTDVDADVVIDTRVSPPRIYVVAESEVFSRPVVRRDAHTDVAGPAEPAAGPTPPKSPSEAYRAFTRAIDVRADWVRDLDLYVSFHARRAKLKDYELEDLLLLVDARHGVFTLAEYRFEIDHKPIAIAGVIDTNPVPPAYALRGEIEGETLESLLDLEEGLITGGSLNGDFRLVTRGDDLAELIEHLHGEALVTVGPLSIGSSILNTVSSDIFLSMLRGITHSKEERSASAYRCGVLGVDVSNGVAVVNKSFAMEADAYNLAGQGRVDLNTGYVDLAVAPKASRGIGLSPSTLVGGFKVEGHMATPNFGLQKGGLLTAAITGYALTPTAALAANPAGATILATGFIAKGLFDRLTARNYTCANTLKRIERNRHRLAAGRTRSPHVPKWRE